MLFQESPLKIYQDVYFLVKAVGFSGEYVDSMVPAEREVYKNLFLKEQEEMKKKESKHEVGLNTGLTA